MVSKDPARVAGGRKAARTAKQRYGGSYHRKIGSRGGRSTAARHTVIILSTSGAWAAKAERPTN
jgi:hypothetical protein